MPTTPHVEKHFTATENVRDIVIGMADGLTVPFALAAGLAAAVSSTSVIVTAGLAEIVAGAIAMGLGGYLAARTDAEHYGAERAREDWEIDPVRHREVEEVAETFRGYGLDGDALNTVLSAVTSDRQRWLDFMMRFALIKPFGIAPARIEAVGLGEEQLLDAAAPEAAKNRRVQGR
jgi:hypothetical protein